MERFKIRMAEILEEVKKQKPLVHQITNYVTVNDCANIVLALGGSPVMADDREEVEEMVSLASTLVLNMGTLNSRTVESMLAAGKRANALGIPVVLDPVGIGATGLRTDTARRMVREVKLAVIRGNMSEIKALAGQAARTRGVDSIADGLGGEETALNLARQLQCVVAMTGARDIISSGRKTIMVHNGHPYLAGVTGTGCMASALVGTFCGAGDDYFLGAVAGLATMGLAGEKAAAGLKNHEGMGAFRMRLFDHVSNLTPRELQEGAKLYEV